ncbi:hypothetical protein L7F22_004790 [Adiantum nelumboides]|nr:hypothetical protein [Adiantum nelumboides]
MTPFQAYYGRKPTVSHFRVFGCSAFVHIPKEKRQKLDFKSRKSLFLGYSAESDAYRLYDLDTRTTTVSRDVVFDESFITSANGTAAQPIPILPPPSLPDPPASPVITPSTSHPVPPIQPPDVSPDHALSDSDSDLDVADATPEVDLAPPRQEKRIPGWLYSTVASSGVTELPVPPPAGLPRCSARLQKRGQVYESNEFVNFALMSQIQDTPQQLRQFMKFHSLGYLNFEGEEPPESLFMKELKRRGLSKRSEEDESRSGLGTETKVDTGEVKSGPQTNSDQRKQSMALNSEGLEGLIPRAQSLLSLGGGFFLAFWPLIVASVAVFVALYFYYGPTFIHSGERGLYSQPSYVDPYELLENERIPPEAGPSFVPFNKK